MRHTPQKIGVVGATFLLVCGFLCVGSSFLYGQTVPGLPTVNDRLQIDGGPEESWKRMTGENIMFRCITGLKDYPVFSWLKDGKPLPRDVIKYQLISNGNSFLEIPKTSIKSEGSYTCTVSNDFGVARKVFKLCVIAPGVKEDCPGWWYSWSRR
ncbi:neural cell adhesion molecule L1 [Folsomia candida]|uniref:Hemicentin-1 n=1 Tax=Folsomia candida TaxID=158441 RepID=A0A226DX00_FOLCA|nr:neural cell adhesion molecule L1 [Folsomia candida]OXA50005.1 Hemicentin-1 [Folsomia candida]